MSRLILLALSVLLSAALVAQTDPTISIQGTLKDANGASVSDGMQSITFRLYGVAAGGDPIWTETADVRVTGGIYSHQLGSVTALNAGDFRGPRWVGIVVDGLELSPRAQLSYAPYAMTVATAEAITPGGCSGQVGDIKYSYLNPTQFAQVNGDCWVPMDGRDIANSALANITQTTRLPDAGGAFLRAQEFAGGEDRDDDRTANTAVGSLQEAAVQPHGHRTDESGVHNHSYTDSHLDRVNTTSTPYQNSAVTVARSGTSNWLRYYYVDGSNADGIDFRNKLASTTTGNSSAHDHTVLPSTDGTETRPENFNFYLYIRIN